MATSTITIKATCGSDTRRLALDVAADFKAFVATLQALYFPTDCGAEFTVTWTDEDGDVITVASDADFSEAKRAQQASDSTDVIRFTVMASTPPPYPPPTKLPASASTPTVVNDTVESNAGLAAGAPGPTKAWLSMLVDRSGSMGSLGSEVLSGIQTYLEQIQASDTEDGSSTSVLLSTFDNTYELAHDGLDLPEALKAITQHDIQPRGMTALWDGIGFVLRDTETKIAALPACDKPDKVIVFILTDGQENASRTWSQATVKRRMEALKLAPHSYEFFFAAAGQDALTTGSHMGLNADECVTWSADPVAARATFQSSAVNAVRCKKGLSRGYSNEQRSRCVSSARTVSEPNRSAAMKSRTKVKSSGGALGGFFGSLNPFSGGKGASASPSM
jgi:uncharacterized protein YegL